MSVPAGNEVRPVLLFLPHRRCVDRLVAGRRRRFDSLHRKVTGPLGVVEDLGALHFVVFIDPARNLLKNERAPRASTFRA